MKLTTFKILTVQECSVAIVSLLFRVFIFACGFDSYAVEEFNCDIVFSCIATRLFRIK